mmetsp:Transcript_45148/g.142043  ORF Transcript_45148/g.142043 Transcript_45148/m.142043 type:complete len:288 (+) Transcript_45148:249-1112(+)
MCGVRRRALPPPAAPRLASPCSRLFLPELKVQLHRVGLGHALPALLVDVVYPHRATRVGVAVGGREDGALGQGERLVLGQVVPVARVQHAIRKRRPRPHREEVVVQPVAVRVDVVNLWARLVPAANHCAHREAVPLVRVRDVGEDLGGGGHRDALLLVQLKHAAAHAEVALPEGAVCCTAGHGAEQEGVDLDDLLHGLRRDVRARRRARVDGDHHPALVLEGECRRAVQHPHMLLDAGAALARVRQHRRRVQQLRRQAVGRASSVRADRERIIEGAGHVVRQPLQMS